MPPAAPAKKSSSTWSAVRTFGPAAPLAVVGLHLALSGSPGVRPVSPPQAGPAPTVGVSVGPVAGCSVATVGTSACSAPYPMLAKGHPVDWWFVFKLNSQSFPKCGNGDTRSCPFGGDVQTGSTYAHFGQQFVFASSEAPALQDGGQECLGTTLNDPVGASFDEVYHGSFHYLLWNDQPYEDPGMACGKSDSCSGPWGHSKGMLAWNDAGEGFVMQVSTPDWPLSGSASHPRQTQGNTLGCLKDNDVEVSQHFFALRLTEPDLLIVLHGLKNASVVTDPSNPMVANNGGPKDVQDLVGQLGVKVDKSEKPAVVTGMLSSGVELISKPSRLQVPPWQMVSSVLGGVSLRVANWWLPPNLLPSTTAATEMGCWSSDLGPAGAVQIATTGHWRNLEFGLQGGANPAGNHAKVAVSTSGPDPYAIFGDMNQEGSFSDTDCSPSQNGRGGTFYVMKNIQLASSVTALLAGQSAPTTVASK